jgi:hypothetical protein
MGFCRFMVAFNLLLFTGLVSIDRDITYGR